MPQVTSNVVKVLIVATLVAGIGISLSQAQDAPYPPDPQDQASGPDSQDSQGPDAPGRVARVNLLDGTASLQPAGSDEWLDDLINRPLTNGDKLWVEDNSRAELHVGSTAVRLGQDTGVQILAIDDDRALLSMTDGTLNVRLRELDQGERFDIRTPSVTVQLMRAGEYRIDTDGDNGTTRVTTYSGSVQVQNDNRYTFVNAGQTGEFGGRDGGGTQVMTANARDDFDRWAEDRDAREESSPSARYVSRDVIGYQDLDNYGDWQSTDDYGEVWYPRVDAAWAPYHYGRWVYIAPWGYSWVDDQPWGFAPCHYGRWVRYHDRWGWAPGPRVVRRPVYAPALVAWVGGNGFGASVGWFPLGYNEIYQPSYRASPGYLRNINRTNTTINVTVINNYIRNPRPAGAPGQPARRYAHQGVPGAVAAVSRDDFAAQRPVERHLVPVNPRTAVAAPASAVPAVRLPPPVGRGIAVRDGRAPAVPAARNDRPAFGARGGQQGGAQQGPVQQTPVQPNGAQQSGGQQPAGRGNAQPGRTFNDRPANSPDARRIPEQRRSGFGGQQPPVQQQPAQQPSVQQPGFQQRNDRPNQNRPDQGSPSRALAPRNDQPANAGQQPQRVDQPRTQEFRAPPRTPEVQPVPERAPPQQTRQIQPPQRVQQAPQRVEPLQRVEPQRVEQPQRVEPAPQPQPPPRTEPPALQRVQPPPPRAQPQQRTPPPERPAEHKRGHDDN